MNLIKPLGVLPIVVGLAACGGSSTSSSNVVVAIDPPQFGAANVNADGSIDTVLIDTYTSDEVTANGDGYGYVVGTYSDQSTVGGFAGLTPSTNLTGAMPAADIQMTGTYRVGLLTDLVNDNGEIVGTWNQEVGLITLSVDVDAETITGSHNDLQVLGSFSGNTLDGTVIYQGMSGNLDGQINGDRSVGHFAGGNADSVYAGGFVVDE